MDGQPVTRKLQLGLRWHAPTAPPIVVNQFLTQIGPTATGAPGEILLTLGHAAPPVLLGPPESVREQVEDLTSVDVVPAAYVSLTRERAHELRDLLQKALDNWDAALVEDDGGEEA